MTDLDFLVVVFETGDNYITLNCSWLIPLKSNLKEGHDKRYRQKQGKLMYALNSRLAYGPYSGWIASTDIVTTGEGLLSGSLTRHCYCSCGDSQTIVKRIKSTC